jgi:hypothetical protein
LAPNPNICETITLLDFGSFVKVLRIVSKSLAQTAGVFCMLSNPPKCEIMHKSKNMFDFNNEPGNLLESYRIQQKQQAQS